MVPRVTGEHACFPCLMHLPRLVPLSGAVARVPVPGDAVHTPSANDDVRPAVGVDVEDVLAVAAVILRRDVIGPIGPRHEVRSGEPVRARHDVRMAIAIEVADGGVLVRTHEQRLLREAQARLLVPGLARRLWRGGQRRACREGDRGDAMNDAHGHPPCPSPNQRPLGTHGARYAPFTSRLASASPTTCSRAPSHVSCLPTR